MFAEASMRARRMTMTLAVASVGMALAGFPAQAEPNWGSAAPPSDDTAQGPEAQGPTVYAPRIYVRQPTTGAIVRLDSVSLEVPLGDLDLSTPDGAYLAKQRIEAAAHEACYQVEARWPSDGETPGGCYTNAVRQGVAQAEHLAGYPIVAWGYGY